MSEIESAAIIGLGLIGGSLARDLAARGVRVFAWDRDNAAVNSAMRQRIADPWLEGTPVDVVVLAVPVLAGHDLLQKVMNRGAAARLVTDAGSTKRSIAATAEQMSIGTRFVGSHPLAGDHLSGWDSSRTGLFEGARVYLTPTRSTDPDVLELARELWAMVGAVPEVMDAAEHDRRLAWTSHLPQAASTALARALAKSGIQQSDLGPGGRDVTRLAGSSPEMWADVLMDNADEVVPAIDALIEELRRLRYAAENGTRERIRDLFADARAWHRQDP